MLNQPSADFWPRSSLVATLWCAIFIVSLAALLVPFAVLAGDSGLANQGPVAVAVTASMIVLGSAVVGWRFLVLRNDQSGKPATHAIAAARRVTAASLPPACRGQNEWPEIDCDAAPGLALETDEDRPWTFADTLIEWTCTGTKTTDERPSTNPAPSSGDRLAADKPVADVRRSALNRIAMHRVPIIGTHIDRVGDCLRVLGRHITEQGTNLNWAEAALGRAMEALGTGTKRVTSIKLASHGVHCRVEAGHKAAQAAAQATASIVGPIQRLSNLISLVAEISCETPLLPQNSEAEKPIAFAPMEHNGVADNDLGTAARRCSAAAEEMRALIFEIEGYARYGYRRAEEAARAMAETRKNFVSFDALAATAVDNDAKLQSYLDEARLCVKRSAKFATLGVAVVKDTGGLAEQAAVAAHGLGHLLSCCTATDQFAVVAHTLEDRTLKAQPDLIIIGGSAFPGRI